MDNAKSSRKSNKKKCTSWEKRTLLERYLILMCLVLFIAFTSLIGVHIFHKYTRSVPTRSICNSPACKREAGRIMKNMDSSVNPCDDFYAFACGSFIKYERVTDERIHGLLEAEEYTLRYSKAAIEESDENMGPEFAKKTRKLYHSCMKRPSDTSEILMELLNKSNLGTFPIYDDAVGGPLTLEEVLAIVITFDDDGMNPLFSISNYEDKLRLDTGKSFMDATMFLDTTDDGLNKRKEKYITLLTLTQVHSTKPSYNIGDEAYDIVDFQISLDNVTSHKREENEIVIKVSELEEICPEIKWENLLKNIYEKFGHPDEVENFGERNITVNDRGYITDICQLISTWGSGIVQNFLVWNWLGKALIHLDPSFHKSFGKIDPGNNVLSSAKHYPIRWKWCISDVGRDMIFEAGLDYLVIERMKPDKNIEEVKKYVNNIEQAMDRVLVKEDWLDDHSRKVLRNQIHEFDSYIGYSEQAIDINLVEKQFEKVVVSDNYIENWLRNRKLQSSLNYFKDVILLQPGGPTMPLMFNVMGGGGFIDIPLAALVPPIFIPDVPKYVNYGSIGFLIGHEILHSFDDAGYLEVINVSAEAVAVFEKKLECYIKQYSALPLDENGVMVDGESTIRDNIADNGGIIQAFSAYQDYEEREGEEESLPGLKYTNRQIFFIKYAQMWCEIVESPAKTYKNDGHSPGKYRVREPLKNFPLFSQEFQCHLGSFMNPSHKCRMWG